MCVCLFPPPSLCGYTSCQGSPASAGHADGDGKEELDVAPVVVEDERDGGDAVRGHLRTNRWNGRRGGEVDGVVR